MVLALSRFRVANAMEGEVRAAFAARPRMVDHVRGFLGLEVFTDVNDPSVFHLVTRWTDRASFETWHASDNHRASHAFIPKGLKLDAAFTQVEVVERLFEQAPAAAMEHRMRDAAPVMARHVAAARALYLMVAAADGTIQLANAAIAERLGASPEQLRGRLLSSCLVGHNAERLGALAAAGRRDLEPMLLNFVGADQSPFTVSATIDVQPDGLVLVAEPLTEKEGRLSSELFQLNNELAVLAREHARQGQMVMRAHAELERVHRELKESHWHLRKIQEVLPFCMRCSKVKTGEGQWDELVRFIQDHSRFLSHGYCPACAQVLLDEMESSEGGKGRETVCE